MICDELSHASFRFVLRCLSAELDGGRGRGGGVVQTLPITEVSEHRPARVNERFLRNIIIKTSKRVIDKLLMALHELPSCGNGVAVSGFAMLKESSGSSGLSNPW